MNDVPQENNFVIQIPKKIDNKANLLLHYAKEGRFPIYFGHNWDALYDCLCDFSWIKQKEIIIYHQDVPLQSDEEELKMYLHILADAELKWKDNPNHTIKVIFPALAESTIKKLYK
jgi:RNAse (barnase) inhibitor barstar